jgi:hypothetical protein
MSRLLTLGAFAVAVSALAVTASAATLEQLSLDQMAFAATAVVRAHVGSPTTARTGSTIYTHYSLSVSETWKGAAPPEVMLPGGVANGIRQTFPGVPELQPGVEYVLFLWTSPSTGITHLVGLTQAIYTVSAQRDGTLTASRPKIGEMMLDSTGHRVADSAITFGLADLRARVRSANGASTLK